MLTACPTGANSVAGSSSIAACTCPLSYILNGTTSCRPCRAGFACASQTSEVQCLAGHFADPQPNPTACATCVGSTYSLDGATACTPCPADASALAPAAASQCTCAEGLYRNSSRVCAPCLAGSQCAGGVLTACPAGSSSAAGAVACTPCALGTYAAAAGVAACAACPGGALILQTVVGTEVNAIENRASVAATTDMMYLRRQPLTASQGSNITRWSFYATAAGCSVTPLIFEAAIDPAVFELAVTFYRVQKGTRRVTTRAGPHTFDFLDGGNFLVRAPDGSTTIKQMQFFGWAFDGAACIPYTEQGTDVTTHEYVVPFTNYTDARFVYARLATPYSPPQFWSVQLTYAHDSIVPATLATGASSIAQCACPSTTRKISDGTCQGLCPAGSYMVNEQDASCTPCPRGSACVMSARTPCPAGTSSLAGSSECLPCAGPGTHTPVALNLCGLLACSAAVPARLNTSEWFGLGHITTGLGGVDLVPSTAAWFPGESVVGLVLNSASDRPVALLQRGFDATPGHPIALQFRYVCTGAGCGQLEAFQVQWLDGGATAYTTVFSDPAVPTTDWVQDSTQFFTPTTSRVTIRIVAKLVPLSAIVWLATPEVVSLGQWAFTDISKLQLLETTTIAVPHSDAYSSQVESSTMLLRSSANLSVAVPTGVYPAGLSYYASVWAKRGGSAAATLRLQLGGAQTWTLTSAWQQLFFTTSVLDSVLVITSAGDAIISSPSVSLRSLTIGCQECLADHWCSEQHIFSCPANSQAAVGTGRLQSDCYCNPGYYGNTNAAVGWTPCSPCDTNFFCTGGNHLERCANGTKSGVGATACYPCPEGEYCFNGTVGTCPTNSRSRISADEVSDCTCVDGYYGTAPDCLRCEPGHFCANGTRHACTGNATSTPGAPSAAYCFCDRGYSGRENAACEPCAEGSFCWVGVSNPCASNMWSPARSSFASNCTCTYGYHRLAPGATCLACGSGTYKPNLGDTGCVQCDVGRFSMASGATSAATCALCDAGTFSDATGQYQCRDCAAGYYTPGLGSTGCATCWAGAYSPAGAAQCTACPAGSMSTVVAAPSSAVCLACPIGSWSPGNGSACNLCGGCAYWSYPRTLFFYSIAAANVYSKSDLTSSRLLRYGGRVIMSHFQSIMYLDLTTGATSALAIESGSYQGVYRSMAASADGSSVYLVRGDYVYRVNMQQLGWDQAYTVTLPTCVVEAPDGVWIAHAPGLIRYPIGDSRPSDATIPMANAHSICLSDAYPTVLFVTGTFGLKTVTKATGAATLLLASTGAGFTVCKFTPDSRFIIVSERGAGATPSRSMAYSLLDGRTTRISSDSEITGIIVDGANLVLAAEHLGVSNITHTFRDSANCGPGKYSRGSGLQLESDCSVCPAGSLCPGGPNKTECAAGLCIIVFFGFFIFLAFSQRFHTSVAKPHLFESNVITLNRLTHPPQAPTPWRPAAASRRSAWRAPPGSTARAGPTSSRAPTGRTPSRPGSPPAETARCAPPGTSARTRPRRSTAPTTPTRPRAPRTSSRARATPGTGAGSSRSSTATWCSPSTSPPGRPASRSSTSAPSPWPRASTPATSTCRPSRSSSRRRARAGGS